MSYLFWNSLSTLQYTVFRLQIFVFKSICFIFKKTVTRWTGVSYIGCFETRWDLEIQTSGRSVSGRQPSVPIIVKCVPALQQIKNLLAFSEIPV